MNIIYITYTSTPSGRPEVNPRPRVFSNQVQIKITHSTLTLTVVLVAIPPAISVIKRLDVRLAVGHKISALTIRA